MAEMDFSDMSEDDIENVLNDIDSGKYNESEPQVEEPAEQEELTDEDTDQSQEAEEADETNDASDGEHEDTEAEDAEDEEENALVEEDTDDEAEEEDGDTEEPKDAEAQDTQVIDQTEHDKYKKFYDEVRGAKFMANGKMTDGFKEPADLIKSQQKSMGLDEKLGAFKKVRPYVNALKERGMMDDEEKFSMAMNLLDGDPEALKQHMKNLGIDPFEMNMDEIAYEGKSQVSNKSDIAIQDAMESARSLGVEDKVRTVVGEQWDKESFQEFVDDPSVRRDVIDHMANGSYDLVMEKISDIRRTDVDGRFSEAKMTDQYRYAVKLLQKEYNEHLSAEQAGRVDQEKQKIEEERKQKEYKNKVETQNKKADQQRMKATSMNTKKPKTVRKKKANIMDLDGDELDKFVDGLIGLN